jgi:cyclic beta-1,2-glucan synthetase
VNVIANERFGCLVSESGAAFTWHGNSRENRLTPWFNDPVADPHGEALYLRDEDAGVFWSPTPGPAPARGDYEVRHGWGYTHFRHTSSELRQDVWQFVPRADTVKVVLVRIANDSPRVRRLSVFAFHEWVLGGQASETRAGVVTEHDAETGGVRAVNPERGEFSEGVAFAAAAAAGQVGPTHVTCDRASFLGRYGSTERPFALAHAATLDGRAGAGLDPCAALQVVVELAPGASTDVVIVLGEAESARAARELAGRYVDSAGAERALGAVRRFWQDMVGAIQVTTPSPAIDLLVNGWLAYQNLSCRMWGRSAFYQSGGAFGFRDQLQDAGALVYLDPAITRRQIILHAEHQFVEGDVLHWWHPPTSKGIRTRFSDDLLWLPYIAAFYVATTGDASVLDELARFLRAPVLEPGEDEIFLVPEDSGERASVYEHCCRAIDRSLTRGAHGLPLMGTGDWNDGMNRVGREGRGESVWLGFFLHVVLGALIPLAERRGDSTRADRYRSYREALATALDDGGWDGGWYRRAYYDDGTPLGSAGSDECRIDAIAQAWAVISGVASDERRTLALDALERHLVSERDGIVRLLTPAFDRTPHDPGYIKGYVPGVRENGGQYTHGALWAVGALAEAGRADRAAPLLAMLSPITASRTPEAAGVYQAEPYVIAADIYGVAPHVGRGGWTWYTGSAGWYFRIALESILGLEMRDGQWLALRPCIPRDWPGFTLRVRLDDGRTMYEVTVGRTSGDGAAPIAGSVDGDDLAVADGRLLVPLRRDGAAHDVRVTLGAGTLGARSRGA